MKRRLFEILEAASHNDTISRFMDIFITLLIVLNVTAVIFETMEDFHNRYYDAFLFFEIFSVMVFSLEYIARVWVCTIHKKYRHPLWGRLRFMITPMALIDLVAIAPFYFIFIHFDSRFLRSVRLFRLLRLLKLGRYSESFKTLANVLRSKKEELTINVFVLCVLLVTASSIMFYVEHETQPEAFSSIPAAMWWGVVTLTTVGYGDMHPVTPIGKLLGATIALMGIGMVALPTGILASGFSDEMKRRKRHGKHCPYCGRGDKKKKEKISMPTHLPVPDLQENTSITTDSAS